MPANLSSESRLIRSFYTRIISNHFPKANQQYNDWKMHWESLHGPVGRKRSARKDVLAKRYGMPEEKLNAAALLYAIETYYVIRLRLKAYIALTKNTSDQGSTLVNKVLSADTFADLGIENYGGGELVNWVPHCVDEDILNGLNEEFQREFARHAAPKVQEPRDEVGPLFQSLIPKQFRHSAGAHYTPDWLADYILATLDHPGSSRLSQSARLVDPHCGSGTFLIAALRKACSTKQPSASEEWHELLSNDICGFDVDPVATIAAKTNLLLFVSWLISTGRYRIEKPLRLPIFCSDTICSAQEQTELFDFVVGNPPWINWEYLPDSYKQRIKPLWPKLGLVDFKGTDKAFSKVDLSVLATYVACDELLKPNGKLGFVLPQSTFKSPKNAKGFRRFQIGANGPHLKVLHVDDLSTTSVFDPATNRPAILFLEKGPHTTYPVSYATWKGAAGNVNPAEGTNWNDAAQNFTIRIEKAQPVDANDPSSSWVHAPESILSSYDAIAGECPYRARTGVFTGGANGVFYLQRLRTLASGNLIVKNIVDRTRRKTAELEFEIEPNFVYPFLRGRDVDSWRADVNPDRLILCPHTLETGMRPVKPQDLKQISPQTQS